MKYLKEDFSPKCQVDDCNKVLEYYSPQKNKYFCGVCASMNMVDDDCVKVPNPLGIYERITISKSPFSPKLEEIIIIIEIDCF